MVRFNCLKYVSYCFFWGVIMSNILYIHTHDMGRFNSIYGYGNYTPNMQKLAQDATVFRNAFCTSPTCSPSRGSLLTGMMPHNNGLIGLTHRGFSLNDAKKHLSYYLKQKGFYNVLCGVQHEVSDLSDLCYDEIYPHLIWDKSKKEWGGERRSDREIADIAANFIKRAKSPFFLSVGFVNPHRPFIKHSDINPDFVAVPPCINDNKDTRSDYADYLTSVREADYCIGVVIEQLKESGLYDDTLIILTTDHGIAFPFMKCNLYDSGTGVTLVIKPMGKPKYQCFDSIVSQLDIFPTICDYLALPKPSWLQGSSLKPLIEGQCEKIHDEIFSEINYHVVYEPVRAVRTKRYKYIKRFEGGFTQVNNTDDGLSKEFLLKSGIREKKVFKEELYDLYFDPNERNNLVSNSEYSHVYKDLKDRLHKFMTKTNDPLLKGSIPAPEGAEVSPL